MTISSGTQEFEGATFVRTSFRGATLRWCDVSGVTMRGVDLDGLDIDSHDGWVAVQAAWEATVANMSAELFDAHVDGEWSLAQTLRHLVLATDAWLRGGITG